MRSRIVALDTSGEYGSLALLEDGQTVEEAPLHSPDGFGHVLFPQLHRLMQRHGWRHESVTGYVAGAGPGSFTGVRVGLAAVKGLAEAAGAKAAAISNLRAVASFGKEAVRAPFYDARRGEIYGGLFDDGLAELAEEAVIALPAWLASLPPDAELITPQVEIFAPALAGRSLHAAPRALAAALGRLGAGELRDPGELDANYVRRSDAELHWREG
jgi:tRNA threonylcarbamoyladenosine biosynthesis protein TsaB